MKESRGVRGETNRRRGAGFERLLEVARKFCRRLVSGEKKGESNAETGSFVSSHGRWPGHEGNYVEWSRMIWELGKAAEEKEGASSTSASRRSGAGSKTTRTHPKG